MDLPRIEKDLESALAALKDIGAAAADADANADPKKTIPDLIRVGRDIAKIAHDLADAAVALGSKG